MHSHHQRTSRCRRRLAHMNRNAARLPAGRYTRSHHRSHMHSMRRAARSTQLRSRSSRRRVRRQLASVHRSRSFREAWQSGGSSPRYQERREFLRRTAQPRGRKAGARGRWFRDPGHRPGHWSRGNHWRGSSAGRPPRRPPEDWSGKGHHSRRRRRFLARFLVHRYTHSARPGMRAPLLYEASSFPLLQVSRGAMGISNAAYPREVWGQRVRSRIRRTTPSKLMNAGTGPSLPSAAAAHPNAVFSLGTPRNFVCICHPSA